MEEKFIIEDSLLKNESKNKEIKENVSEKVDLAKISVGTKIMIKRVRNYPQDVGSVQKELLVEGVVTEVRENSNNPFVFVEYDNGPGEQIRSLVRPNQMWFENGILCADSNIEE